MLKLLSNWVVRTASAIGVTLALGTPAVAGFVSGDLDPPFGAALPGLNWGAHFELLVPNNACLTHSGVQALTGDCAGVTMLGFWTRLYDTGIAAPDWTQPATYFSIATPNNPSPRAATYQLCDSSVSSDPNYTSRCTSPSAFGNWFNLTAINLLGGEVIGLDATMLTGLQTAVNFGFGPESLPHSAQAHLFKLNLFTTGPQLVCTNCPSTAGPVVGDNTHLNQLLVTYTSNDSSTPLQTADNGRAVGVRLDGAGNVIGRSTSVSGNIVPEPAGVALTLTALAAAALARRRRG